MERFNFLFFSFNNSPKKVKNAERYRRSVPMEYFEKLLKLGVLYAFCFLNAIDLVQTLSFLRMGIEGNPFVVYYPYLWFPLKFVLAFGLPIGLYQLDLYLTKKENGSVICSIRPFVDLFYLTLLVADIFFLFLVLRNMSILGGRLLP